MLDVPVFACMHTQTAGASQGNLLSAHVWNLTQQFWVAEAEHTLSMNQTTEVARLHRDAFACISPPVCFIWYVLSLAPVLVHKECVVIHKKHVIHRLMQSTCRRSFPLSMAPPSSTQPQPRPEALCRQGLQNPAMCWPVHIQGDLQCRSM